jgi:hypothetical protein
MEIPDLVSKRLQQPFAAFSGHSKRMPLGILLRLSQRKGCNVVSLLYHPNS